MSPLLISLLIFGSGAALVAVSKPKVGPAPVPAPWDGPLPKPPPPPGPGPGPAVLLAQLASLLSNPNADPGQLELLALQLDTAGLTVQAKQARDLAAQIRARQTPPGPPPPPAPLPTDVLMASYNAMLAQAVANPQLADPDMMDYVSQQLQAAGKATEAASLHTAANTVRVAKGLPPKP